MRVMPTLFTTIFGLCAALPLALPSPAVAAEWLAPAADEQITAGWVKDVAKAFKSNRFKNVFMNQPFGCDQCQILGYLNDAAEALENDQTKLAKSFVHRALGVLQEGREQHWYSEADIRPIKRLIIKKANQGFREAGGSQAALSPPSDRGRDPRYERGDAPLFSRSQDEDRGFGSRKDRWSGYTSNRPFGLTNEPPDRDGGYRGSASSDRRGRYPGRYEEKDFFSDQYADELAADQPRRSSQRAQQNREDRRQRQDRMSSKDAGFHDMSREEFRRMNQRHYDDRFATAEELKGSADQDFDADRYIGPRGPVRHPGD